MRTLKRKFKDSAFKILTPCATCKHRISPLTCKAFPTQIPQPILRGANKHTEPFLNDNGIQYERKKDA